MNMTQGLNQPSHAARFLIDDKIQYEITRIRSDLSSESDANPTTSSLLSKQMSNSSDYFEVVEKSESFYEFQKVHLGRPTQTTYYLIPYNLAKLTFFIFIPVARPFQLSLLKDIDDLLAQSMVEFSQEIANQVSILNQIAPEEKEIKYIYFNRFNLAQKSTINSTKDLPKYMLNLISQLSKDLEE